MAAKAAKTTDRRVVRTRRVLREALVSLILERGWDEVSVLDVCHEADISRSTFYAHFGDKEDLLVSGFDDLHGSLQALRKPGADFSFVEPLVEHARENLRLFRAVIGKRSGQTVQRRFREVVRNLVETEIREAHLDIAKREAVVRYVAGGFVELLTWWLDRPGAVQPAELAKTFRILARRTLVAAR